MPLPGSEISLTKSPSWDETVESYREDLGGSDEYDSILEEGSVEGLINHLQTLWLAKPSDKKMLNPMNQLRSIVKFFSNFSELTAVYFNAGTAPTSLVWGSIRLILTLASSDVKSLRDVLDMLEELSLVLPRFKAYEEILPLDNSLQCSLLIIYGEYCCFCARTVNVLRKGEHIQLRQKIWGDFQADFVRTIQRVKRLCSNVEREADIVAMQFERRKYFDALVPQKNAEKSKPSPAMKPSYFLPLSAARFCGREDALELVDQALFLKPEEENSLRSFVLHGMGGVGKSEIALKYVEGAREKFDTILWIYADSLDSLGQSFREIARKWEILESDEGVDDNAVMLRVKNWLFRRTKRVYRPEDSRWLLIFDNADDINILKHAWPKQESMGSVLVTTRDFNVAFDPASRGYQVKPFDDTAGTTLLLNLLGLNQSSIPNLEKAKEIACIFGGLPLALNQIAKFMHLRKLPLQNFLRLYQRRSAEIDSRSTAETVYEDTLSTVWDRSLEQLSGDSKMLQMLLSLFDPECIHESLLIAGSENIRDQDFAFLENELELLDAEAELLRLALIDKSDDEDGRLSIHKLIQTAILRRMSHYERVRCFDVAVYILSSRFPDTYPGSAECTQGDDCMPHIEHLVGKSKAYNIRPRDAQTFAELLLRCSWFLFDMDYRERARDCIKLALDNFSDKSSLAHKNAIDLLNLIDPSTADVQQEQEQEPRGKVNTRARFRSKSVCEPRARSRKR